MAEEDPTADNVQTDKHRSWLKSLKVGDYVMIVSINYKGKLGFAYVEKVRSISKLTIGAEIWSFNKSTGVQRGNVCTRSRILIKPSAALIREHKLDLDFDRMMTDLEKAKERNQLDRRFVSAVRLRLSKLNN